MDLEKHIKEHEGLKLKPYLCPTNHWSIGYGFNLENVIPKEIVKYLIDNEVLLYKEITEETALYLLRYKIKEAKSELLKIFDDRIAGFTINRYNALVDMMFNMGYPTFIGFKSMIQAIKDSDWDTAAKEALNSLWAKQVGKRAEIDAFNLKVG